MIDDDMVLMEYIGYITQLGAPLATIGIDFITPLGGYIEVIYATIIADNLSAVKWCNTQLFDSQDNILHVMTSQLDNKRLALTKAVIDNVTQNVALAGGFPVIPIILPSLYYLSFLSGDTYDANKILTVSIMYKSRKGVIPTITPIGAGITLTEVVNRTA